MADYKDIINMPRHVSRTRHPMSNHDRAAQFAPFAALTGYDEVIFETARLTDKRESLSDEDAELLNSRLRALIENIREKPEVILTLFVPDERKEGGAYVSRRRRVRAVDEVNGTMLFTDGTSVPLADIFAIETNL